MINEIWYHCILYIKEPYECFGIAAIKGTVTKASPNYSWMIGKQLTELRNFFIKNKALVAEIK